jgi:hypothetical protein
MKELTYNMPWIESPFFERELQSANLSEQDKTFICEFAQRGYAIIDTTIDHAVFDAIIQDLDAQFKTNQEKHKGNHHASHRIQDAWQFNEKVKAVATNKDILEKLQLLYRRRPIPFQTLNFDVGTEQRTHSDMIHFSSIPERFMCGVWIAFEDVTEDNGPLHYYPGSHKMPFYNMTDMGVKASDGIKMKNMFMDYSDYYEEFIGQVAISQGLKKEKLLIKKGQGLIWAANLLHGGEPINRPGTTRYSQVSHYYFEDCVYYTPLFTDFAIKEIFLRNITDITTGQPVPNKYLGATVNEKGLVTSETNEKRKSFWKALTKPFHGISKRK